MRNGYDHTSGDGKAWDKQENGTAFVMSEETANGHLGWGKLNGAAQDTVDGDTTTQASSWEDSLSRDLSLGSLGKGALEIHSIIFRDFGEIDVDVYLSGCQACVVEQLDCGGFFSHTITKSHLFATVHDAVLFCLSKQGASAAPSYDCALGNEGGPGGRVSLTRQGGALRRRAGQMTLSKSRVVLLGPCGGRSLASDSGASPSTSSMKKKRAAQSGASGIRVTALG
ncbi:hypothetical protein JZ751_014567 [Albula glossodonta]|uniref:Uncharacterized protein n=1 Tax=Albula glossodonta TaxID=121402 RepID=A0A8T2MVS8_9TELE|nr:hypothetical protein JZ751_014567 [Albula glossodonta]